MHQKAGPCRALWRMESNHAEQGQAEGRKERGLQTVFWLVWDSAQQCKEMGLGHKDGLARLGCAQYMYRGTAFKMAPYHLGIVAHTNNLSPRELAAQGS